MFLFPAVTSTSFLLALALVAPGAVPYVSTPEGPGPAGADRVGAAPAGAEQDSVGPFQVRVIRPEGGPEVVAHALGGPLVSLRLSAPVRADHPEGVVELLQELARPGARETVERLGARLSFTHEDGHAVIAVTGPVTGFDALVGVLREATGEPDLTGSALRQARARSEDLVLSRLEQPGPRVQRLLWAELFGGPPPRGAAATLLSPEGVRAEVQRLYHPSRLRVVVVGDVPDPVLRAAFSRWPGSAGVEGDAVSGAIPADSVAAAQPETHREWAGIGYRVDAEPEVAAVATELIARRLRRSSLRHGAARAWRGPDGWAIVVLGATEPGDSVVSATAGVGTLPVEGSGPNATATGVGVYLRRTMAEALALLGPRALEEVRTDLRRRLLLESRTVTGRAAVLGRLSDALGPEGTAAFVPALEGVELEAVRALLQELLDTPATYVEAR